MTFLEYELIAERKQFSKKLFLTEFITMGFGLILILTDVLLMIFLYQTINVSTIILSSIFALILLLCLFQIIVYSQCNRRGKEAILFDENRNIYLIRPLFKKECKIKKENIIDISVQEPFFDKKKDYGKVVIYYLEDEKKKKASLSFLLNYQEVAKKIK